MRVVAVKTENIALNKYFLWLAGFGAISFGFISNFVAVGIIAEFGIFAGFYAVTWLLVSNLQRVKFGNKLIYLPLSIIGISMIASNISCGTFYILISALTVFYYFELYLVAGLFREQITKMFTFAVIIEAASVIIISLVFGVRNGGLASYFDYNIATGILVFGSILAIGKNQWVIVTIGLVGLFFTGSLEGMVTEAILLMAVIVRNDFSRRLVATVGLVLLIAGLGLFPFQYTKQLYSAPIDRIFSHNTASVNQADSITNGRVSLAENGIKNISLFGSGYRFMPSPGDGTIHNVPLVIFQQVGPTAAAAWVFVTIYSFIKSRWKYAFVALFALCLFDHFMWAHVGAWWWILIGMSSFSTIDSDLIFKRIPVQEN
jgi:hypothetical protein